MDWIQWVLNGVVIVVLWRQHVSIRASCDRRDSQALANALSDGPTDAPRVLTATEIAIASQEAKTRLHAMQQQMHMHAAVLSAEAEKRFALMIEQMPELTASDVKAVLHAYDSIDTK